MGNSRSKLFLFKEPLQSSELHDQTLDKYIREDVCEDEDIKNKIDDMRKYNLHKLQLMPCFKYAKINEHAILKN